MTRPRRRYCGECVDLTPSTEWRFLPNYAVFNTFPFLKTGIPTELLGSARSGSKAMVFGYQYAPKHETKCRLTTVGGALRRKLYGASYLVLTVSLAFLTGCSGEPPQYRANTLYAASLTHESADASPEQLANQAKSLVDQLFGSIDSPLWPEGLPTVVDMEHVARSAGPVGRAHDKIERGLYRKHCAQCHGVSGDGSGPAAALLAPYPRDFRRGTFKFKSTEAGAKPLHEDIVKTITLGIPGSSMPGFGTLNASEEFSQDIESLSHYVRFLAIRGEVERRVMRRIYESEAGKADDNQSKDIARNVAETVIQAWKESEARGLKVPNHLVANDAASIERGKQLFSSELTACVKCHGNDGTGKGTVPDYDEWTKDWTIRAGIDPTQKSEWRTMKKYGALKPVPANARNLTLGAFRGGSSADELFRRLAGGIEGSPMPAVARASNGNPGLSDNDLWDLIHYVQSLGPKNSKPSESDSGKPQPSPTPPKSANSSAAAPSAHADALEAKS